MLRSSSNRSRTAAFSLLAKTEIGRVCGTSASIAPRKTTAETSAASIASTTSAAKVFQPRDGSVPSSTCTAMPESVGMLPGPGPYSVTLGHSSVRSPASSIETVGRLNW